MSTIKSSSENLTLNADGSGNDVIIQSNASTKAIVTAEGTVGIGTDSIDERLHVQGSGHERIQIESTISADAVIIHKNTENTWKVGATSSIGGYGGDGKYSIADGADVRLAIHPTTGYVSAVQGMVFGSDTTAANALDDYEEGTHAASFTAASSGTITIGRNDLGYTKVGRLVTITGEIEITSVSSPTGGTRLTLPFVVASAAVDRDTNFGCPILCYGVDEYEDRMPMILGQAGNSYVTFLYHRHDASFYDFNAAAADVYYLSFSYMTA